MDLSTQEAEHLFTMRYKVQGPRCRPPLHNWIDITAIDSPDNRWLCADCGLMTTESKTQHDQQR